MFITVGTVLLQQGFQVFQAFFFTSQDANDENVFSSRICQVFVLDPSGHASYRVLFVACQSSCQYIYIYIYISRSRKLSCVIRSFLNRPAKKKTGNASYCVV
jgi:hypothetical protein